MLPIYYGVIITALLMLVGSIIYIALKKKFPASIDVLLGISAGMLLCIIFMGIIPEGLEFVHEAFDHGVYPFVFGASVCAGAILVIAFEKLLPVEHHHDVEEASLDHAFHHRHLVPVILVSFGLHSLFELLSILVLGSTGSHLVWAMMVVIALHNIPIGFILLAQLEGMGISQKKSFRYLILLAIGEALVAIICYLLLASFITDALQGVLLAMTSGIMLYLVFDELLPEIYAKENQHRVNYAVIAGVLVMLLFIATAGHSH